jgi:hypothetical protein
MELKKELKRAESFQLESTPVPLILPNQLIPYFLAPLTKVLFSSMRLTT